LKIALIEPYFGGSHKEWAEGFKQHLEFETEIFSLRDNYWKWRMHGGAISLAKKFNESDFEADLILATDMLDLGTFLALTRQKSNGIPTAIYFHENQLAYPWQEDDRDIQNGRNLHYAFINYSSALAADRVFFNSAYNQMSFLEGLEKMLRFYPDNRNLDSIDSIRENSQVLHLGIDLERFDRFEKKGQNATPVLLWNHRWEHDKNPEEFFETLIELKEEGFQFKLIVLGESYGRQPEIFEVARSGLQQEIIHFGYVESFEEYARLLKSANILPVTSMQDFFGISVVEAAYCDVTPLLPRRLAFPELFKDENLFYKEGDFKKALKNSLRQFPNQRSMQKQVKNYSWKSMKSEYSECIVDLINSLG